MGRYKVNRPPYLPARILKFDIEALLGFSHVVSPDGLNNTLISQDCILETSPTTGTMGRIYITRTGIACGGSDCQDSASGPTTCLILSISFSERTRRVKLKRKDSKYSLAEEH